VADTGERDTERVRHLGAELLGYDPADVVRLDDLIEH
jgi:hypothetical protein